MSSSSSTLTTYDLTVPILVRALEQLKAVLQKGEQWCKDNNKDANILIEGKLAPDMKPLTFQVQTCSNTAKGILFRLGGESNTAMDDTETSFADLYARLDKTVALLRDARRDRFAAPDTPVEVKMGPKTAHFDALGYVQKFVLPNYFFHHMATYAILRKEGVPVGKVDYLGADVEEWKM